MKTKELVSRKPWLGWLIFLAIVVAVFLLGILASSIIERRSEAVFAYTPRPDFPAFEPASEKWGDLFPREFYTYLLTAETGFCSKYNGSALIDMLQESPGMVILWAGYSFSKDYKQGRGHYYSVEDILQTLRTGAPGPDKPSPAPNTCWTCKSSNVPGMIMMEGAAGFYKDTWEKRIAQVINPVGCADCHDAGNMNLLITHPALAEAFRSMGRDISRVSHQEMRSLVCAQCHVEYYFNNNIEEGVDYLVFPWKNGLTVEEIEKYYDEIQFSDWTHALSRTPMIKAQHPDYEVYLTGTHASRGVACADCHMPFISEGGQKFTDHHIQSPLNNVANSCQVCHREETTQLISDVYQRQDRIMENRRILEELLVRCHLEAKTAWDKGAEEEQMKEILRDIRRAQWRWDFVATGHGNSFHSPVESSRIIAAGIALASEARLKLARLLASLGYYYEVTIPDISTKARAQEFINLDMKKLVSEKKDFIEKISNDRVKGK
ncbi:MAG: ammonia-forming cytochrome c nitrite reductase subunit c552 [Bacteroidales bacterium]